MNHSHEFPVFRRTMLVVAAIGFMTIFAALVAGAPESLSMAEFDRLMNTRRDDLPTWFSALMIGSVTVFAGLGLWLQAWLSATTDRFSQTIEEAVSTARANLSALRPTNMRERLRTASPYIVAIGAFWSFWQANAYSRVEPFTDAQWRQLGWTLAIVAAVLFWRFRRRAR